MKKFQGVLLALVSSATFGFIPLFSIPLLESGIELPSVCFYRFALASFFMWLICRWKGVSLRMTGKEILAMGILSVFYAATSFFLTASYRYISSGTATTIHFFYPVVVASVMMLFFGEKASLPKIAAIVLGISGVFFLSGGFEGKSISVVGLLLVLVTIITYPTYIVGVNRTPVIMRMNGMKMTFYVLFFSAIILFVNVLANGARFSPLTTAGQWTNAVCLAIIPTLISDFALIYAVRMVGSTVTAILGCMEPLVAVVNGIIFFREKFSWGEGTGMALVFAAVFMIIILQNKERAIGNSSEESHNGQGGA